MTFRKGMMAWTGGAGGGSDPWTYINLAADFPTSLATWTTVTGMTFTPAANTDYEVEWCLLCLTAVTTTGARPGVAWGTGYQYGGVQLASEVAASQVTAKAGSWMKYRTI